MAESLTLRLRRDLPVVAWLTTVADPPVRVPLGSGLTFVGRSERRSHHAGWPRPYLVEGHQWFVRCEDGAAAITDASSTNQSVLVRADAPRPEALNLAALAQAAKAGARGLVRIEHEPPSSLDAHRWIALGAGDLLVTAYAAFEFTWAPKGKKTPLGRA